jgi:CubicO group peptidase (beta-lactamase class C family)
VRFNKKLAEKLSSSRRQSSLLAIPGPKFEAHGLQLKTLQGYVKLYGERDLQFESGTRWEYSNYGLLLLGVLIEKVSGNS